MTEVGVNSHDKEEESLPDASIGPVPINQTRKPQNSWQFLLIAQKYFASAVGNN